MVGAGKKRRQKANNAANKAKTEAAPAADVDVGPEVVAVDEPEHTEAPLKIDQYDGPSGPMSPRPRRDSNVGSPPMSPRPGTALMSGRSASPGRAMVDPALSRPDRRTDMCRNVDLSPELYRLDNIFFKEVPMARRPGFNTTGKEIQVQVNVFPITQFPTKKVYQYDVIVGNGAEKRIVTKKVWESRTRKQQLGTDFIFDGNKLAWSLRKLDREKTISVDLDGEEGRSDSKRPNVFRLAVRYTKEVNLVLVQELLRGNQTVKIDALECLNFLDHLLRETPSTRFLALKRSFFHENNPKMHLGAGVYAYTGIYQAIRMVHPGQLSVNVDISNTCFFATYALLNLALAVLELRDPQQLIANCKPLEDGFGGIRPSAKFQQLNRLRKLAVRAAYKGCPCPEKEWVIKEFVVGSNAKNFTIDITDPATGKKTTKSINDYFKQKYDVTLDFPELPLVRMTKKSVVYPMELLKVMRPQKYPFKLNEIQTANMIKFAVKPPEHRLNSIKECKNNLQHESDPVLRDYGLKISSNLAITKARLLPNPEIMFGGNQKHNPGTNGRWDLRGKKFFAKNPRPLKSWGIGIFKGRTALAKAQAEGFADAFVRAYQGHGGDVSATRPVIMEVPPDPAKAVYELWHATGNKFNARPDLLIFVVQDKQSFHYLRIKKSCDCRFGVPSQVLQVAQVVKCNGQYISNVLMKVNAKLGGTTSKAVSKVGLPPGTMIVGADVSHASPGSHAASMAAMTVSMDAFGGRYLAGCDTNGDRVEIITQTNIKNILSPLFREWCQTVGQGRVPANLMYFRDGVSEGQFQHVLQQEIPFMKEILKGINQGKDWPGKVTVVICSKRHHIRAFPKPGDRMSADRNGNPLPGTLIERDVTSPHNWDFFLYSHIALQGTSRPVHYHVLYDDIGCPANVLQNMIYDHCYQYMRSTTSVSLFPAVYYAHLASNRARHHEDVAASSGPQSGPGIKQNQPPPTEPQKVEYKPLLPMAEGGRLAFNMWYI